MKELHENKLKSIFKHLLMISVIFRLTIFNSSHKLLN